MKKGTFCISIDFELLWGRKDLNYKSFIKGVKKEKYILRKILDLFGKYNIPATWATVGKISEKGNSMWSAPETIKEISKYKNQEIASHSYSHEIFPQIGREKAKEEINKTRGLSFVFPRNRIAHLDLLKKYGFICFRGPDASNLELLLPRTPPVYNPETVSGLINIPGSMYFVSGRGIRKFIPKGLRFMKAKLGIDEAIKQNKIFHLWFHPIDFAEDSDKLFSELEKILSYVDLLKKEGKLEVSSMGQIAKEAS